MSEISAIVIELTCNSCEYDGCCSKEEIKECSCVKLGILKLKEFIDENYERKN